MNTVHFSDVITLAFQGVDCLNVVQPKELTKASFTVPYQQQSQSVTQIGGIEYFFENTDST